MSNFYEKRDGCPAFTKNTGKCEFTGAPDSSDAILTDCSKEFCPIRYWIRVYIDWAKDEIGRAGKELNIVI